MPSQRHIGRLRRRSALWRAVRASSAPSAPVARHDAEMARRRGGRGTDARRQTVRRVTATWCMYSLLQKYRRSTWVERLRAPGWGIGEGPSQAGGRSPRTGRPLRGSRVSGPVSLKLYESAPSNHLRYFCNRLYASSEVWPRWVTERDRLRRWGAELFLSFNAQRNRCDFLKDLHPDGISCFQRLVPER